MNRRGQHFGLWGGPIDLSLAVSDQEDALHAGAHGRDFVAVASRSMVLGFAHQFQLLIRFIDALVSNRHGEHGRKEKERDQRFLKHGPIVTNLSPRCITFLS